MTIARLSTKGQLVIPAALREKLGWEAGTEVEVIEADGEIVLRSVHRARKTRSVDEVAGMLRTHTSRRLSVEEMGAAVDRAMKGER